MYQEYFFAPTNGSKCDNQLQDIIRELSSNLRKQLTGRIILQLEISWKKSIEQMVWIIKQSHGTKWNQLWIVLGENVRSGYIHNITSSPQQKVYITFKKKLWNLQKDGGFEEVRDDVTESLVSQKVYLKSCCC